MAFQDIASESAPSTSSSKKLFYDVFINHRGVDVKHTLASNIYRMLDAKGVKAFLHNEEEEAIEEVIEEAMRNASIHIAIFSPRYAESPCCLRELWLMLRTNATIIPVFFGVKPADLRFTSKGIYADAIREYREKDIYNPEKIDDWERALSNVSYRNGTEILDADKSDKEKLRKKTVEIVETVLQKMEKAPLEVARFPVGLDEAVQDFEKEVGYSTGRSNVHIVGIVGSRGVGKTTLAKELYNRNSSLIRRCSFLSDVSYAASNDTLHNLQGNLLKDLRIDHSEFHNKDKGKEMLAKADLKSVTVLIVLDDVDHVDQMDDLLPKEMICNFGWRSFIIITTRDEKVVTSWGISSIYHVKPLDPFKAKQLFRRHAFSHYDADFEDLIEKFVEACKRLPLSLKVYGEIVKGRSREFWESQLPKISRILPKEISESL